MRNLIRQRLPSVNGGTELMEVKKPKVFSWSRSSLESFQSFYTSMEEEEEASAAMDTKYPPRKIDFNAPLLSTRRVMISTLELPGNSHGDTRNRVPFSWEQSPGKPKHLETREIIDSPVPPPRPPPGWQHPFNQENHYDGDDEDDNFSDGAMDTFSLSEALDIMVEHRNVLGDFSLDASRGSESPSFIIQRFLSDAKALAVSSAGLNISKNHSNMPDFDFPGKSSCAPQGVLTMESCSSPKGCGLDAFFPWRMKHKPCGLKSPVRVTSTNVKPRYCSTRQKQNCSPGQSPSRSGVSMIFSSTSNSKK